MCLPPVVRGVRMMQRDGLRDQDRQHADARLIAPTFVERAYDHLLAMILSVQIKPGDRIAIDKVARRLEISQTPVREALSQLEAERLVIRTPNVGYRASPPMSRAEVQDVYTLRQLIEPYAAAQAAANMDAATLAVLEEIDAEMGAMEQGAGGQADERSYARFAEADGQLHRLIADASGNHLIAETIERLHAHLQIFRSLYATNAPQEAAAEHKRIIAALAARDPKAAETALRDHLVASQQRLDQAITRDDEARANARRS